MRHSIYVSHNAEIAHRLSQLPGKCQKIHGHSMMIDMELAGKLDEDGILGGLDFGSVKAIFRDWIDQKLDHHLHLNENDEWAEQQRALTQVDSETVHYRQLPGLVTWPGDPTTENMAKWIAEAMWERFKAYATSIRIDIKETNSNGATCELP